MIRSNGIDLVCVSQFARLADPASSFVAATFTPAELKYAKMATGETVTYLAARYAAKEALIKALDGAYLFRPPLLKSIDYREIEVAHDPHGRPYFLFYGAIKNVIESLGATAQLSVSHDGDYATAFVIII